MRVLAVLAVALGLYVAGVPLVMLEDGGWPWNGSVTTWTETGRSRAELVHDGGRVETYEGTSAEVGGWLSRREAELKREYGVDRKIAAGHVLIWSSYALVAATVVGIAVARSRRGRGAVRPRRRLAGIRQEHPGRPAGP
jgi:hypothetical protein